MVSRTIAAPRRVRKDSRYLDVIVHVMLAVLLVVTLFPVLHIAAVSLSDPQAFFQGRVSIFPVGFTVQAYRLIFETDTVPRSFANSILYTSVGTVINLALTALMAYPLSRKRTTFRRFYITVVAITMFFSGGLIPRFLLVAKWLGLYNTIWALVVPVGVAAWNLIIMRTFFQTIPVELEESAFIDGANDLHVFFRIVLPLSGASLATIGLFYAVGHWNSWFNAMIYLKDSDKYPLQLVLRAIVIEGQMAEELAQQGDFSAIEDIQDRRVSVEAMKYSTLFVSIVPMLVVYPFVQKYFVKGVLIGSLKG